jgi:hypothetical protein
MMTASLMKPRKFWASLSYRVAMRRKLHSCAGGDGGGRNDRLAAPVEDQVT